MSSSHHWGWIILAFVALISVEWIVTSNRPDQYQKGAVHAEQHRQDWPLSIHIGEGGCAHLDTAVKPTPKPEVKK